MIVLDTCAIIFDALTPNKLSKAAKKAIIQAEKANKLFCADISLWEIAMLIERKRLDPGVDAPTFMQLALQARKIQVLSINIEIAALSAEGFNSNHSDPADRIIAATAIYHHANLVTCDAKLKGINDLKIIW